MTAPKLPERAQVDATLEALRTICHSKALEGLRASVDQLYAAAEQLRAERDAALADVERHRGTRVALGWDADLAEPTKPREP